MYQSPNIALWSGRTDTEDGEAGYRWHQIIKPLVLPQQLEAPEKLKIAFIGFCCDEGVRRNKGRVGAKKGPDALRKAMSSLPVHFDHKHTGLYDAGNVICSGTNLETCQELLGNKIALLLGNGFFPLVLGGGHETAYGHYLGIHQYLKKNPDREPLGIFNIDAHFDLRSYAAESSSGTPFRQIADLRRNHDKDFRYLVAGIQESGNTQALFQTANRLNTEYILAEHTPELANASLQEWLKDQQSLYLTLDLDAIRAADAPGVSAPSVFGLEPVLVRSLLQTAVYSTKLLSLDIAEYNPDLDADGRTARLCAQLVFSLVKNLNNLHTV